MEAVQSIRFIKKRLIMKLGLYKPPRMLEGELDFFRVIHKQCKVIVDVGARHDTDFIQISKGNGIAYYLFEANPRYFKKLKENVSSFKEIIHAENVAVGEKDGWAEYYEDTESLVFGTLGIDNSQMKSSKPLKLVRLDDYFGKMGVSQIDFLKTDIEAYDYFALVGCGEFLSKCRYIQFELGIGAPLSDTTVSNEHYWVLLGKWFDLYILKDENNPMWSSLLVDSNLVRLDDVAKVAIERAQKTGVGFNIVGVNRFMETDLGSLTISAMNQNQHYAL